MKWNNKYDASDDLIKYYGVFLKLILYQSINKLNKNKN